MLFFVQNPPAFSDKLDINIRIGRNFQKNKTGGCMLWRQEKYSFLINIRVHKIPEEKSPLNIMCVNRMIICKLLSIFLCL